MRVLACSTLSGFDFDFMVGTAMQPFGARCVSNSMNYWNSG